MERLRPSLTGYCYRMLGSGFEAEDATQEALLRAWRRADTLGDPAALKSWLFSIATNVCLDQIDARNRRARPVDLADPGTAASPLGAPLPETTWVLPIASGQVADPDADPAAQAAERESLRLAKEVADVLETSVASVNSALQRARATLDELDLEDAEAPTRPSTEDESRLLEQYLEAFAEYDIDRIVALLRYDVAFDMPPLPLWVRGPSDVHDFMLGPGAACRGSKLIALSANGLPAYASYKPDPESGDWLPWSVTLLEMEPAGSTGGALAPRITGVHNFLAPFMPNLFPSFGIPESLDASAPTVSTV